MHIKCVYLQSVCVCLLFIHYSPDVNILLSWWSPLHYNCIYWYYVAEKTAVEFKVHTSYHLPIPATASWQLSACIRIYTQLSIVAFIVGVTFHNSEGTVCLTCGGLKTRVIGRSTPLPFSLFHVKTAEGWTHMHHVYVIPFMVWGWSVCLVKVSSLLSFPSVGLCRFVWCLPCCDIMCGSVGGLFCLSGSRISSATLWLRGCTVVINVGCGLNCCHQSARRCFSLWEWVGVGMWPWQCHI